MTPPKDCSLITALLLVPLIFDHTLNPHLPMGLSYPEPSPLDYNLSNALGNNLGGHIEKMPWFFCLLVSTHNLFNWTVLTLTEELWRLDLAQRSGIDPTYTDKLTGIQQCHAETPSLPIKHSGAWLSFITWHKIAGISQPELETLPLFSLYYLPRIICWW